MWFIECPVQSPSSREGGVDAAIGLVRAAVPVQQAPATLALRLDFALGRHLFGEHFNQVVACQFGVRRGVNLAAPKTLECF